MTMFGGVRFDPEDLPRFAGDLFDHVAAGGTAPDVDGAPFADAVGVLAGSGGGAVDADVFDAAELLGYLLAVVHAETSLPDAVFVEPVDARERRSRVEEAVRRIVGYRA
ncbi:MAG: hypothetical protein AAGC90_05370 [Curtobacterium sp.]